MPQDADRIPVGYIKRAHGVRGDVLVVPLTDHPGRFVPGARLLLGEPPETVQITAVRTHNEGVILRIAEFNDRDAAEAVRKQTLCIEAADRRRLDEGEFWPDQLVGLRAVAADGAPLGTISDVILGAAQDRLVVTTPLGSQVEVPFVAAMVDAPTADHIVIHPPQGLFPE